MKNIEINVEHILDCLDRYNKGELTKEQVNEKLTIDEKVFLIMNQDFLKPMRKILTYSNGWMRKSPSLWLSK